MFNPFRKSSWGKGIRPYRGPLKNPRKVGFHFIDTDASSLSLFRASFRSLKICVKPSPLRAFFFSVKIAVNGSPEQRPIFSSNALPPARSVPPLFAPSLFQKSAFFLDLHAVIFSLIPSHRGGLFSPFFSSRGRNSPFYWRGLPVVPFRETILGDAALERVLFLRKLPWILFVVEGLTRGPREADLLPYASELDSQDLSREKIPEGCFPSHFLPRSLARWVSSA